MVQAGDTIVKHELDRPLVHPSRFLFINIRKWLKLALYFVFTADPFHVKKQYCIHVCEKGRYQIVLPIF